MRSGEDAPRTRQDVPDPTSSPEAEGKLLGVSPDLVAAGRLILRGIGEDWDRGGLQETPGRFARACTEWFQGYAIHPEDLLKTFEDGAEGQDEVIAQTNIPVWSHCEHHIAPFFGVAHIGYRPSGKIVGLSKLARVVHAFAQRLQVQERLTAQIAECLRLHLSEDVAVILRCRHTCMESRGVEIAGTETTTSAMYGIFRTKPEARSEFMSLVSAR